jgi:hypothetical protein
MVDCESHLGSAVTDQSEDKAISRRRTGSEVTVEKATSLINL